MKIYKVKVNGKTYKVELESMEEVKDSAPSKPVEAKPAPAPVSSTGEGQEVVSPIQGTVVNVKVKVGDKVKKGDVVCVVEAMKLENDVVSTFDGEVSEVLVAKGQAVTAKQALVKVK